MELSHEELTQASAEDIEFFNKCIEGLPTREGFKGNFMGKDNVEIPHSSGPHIIRHFKEAFDIVKPKTVLEIGFNIGHGSALILNTMNLFQLVSTDISDKWETKYAAMYLEKMHPKFTFIERESLEQGDFAYSIDMAFVDAAHDEESIVKDILLCKELGIAYLLFDDWYPRYGETQKAVARFPELELVKDMNNLRLYKWQNL